MGDETSKKMMSLATAETSAVGCKMGRKIHIIANLLHAVLVIRRATLL